MARSKVLVELCSDSELAEALRIHAAERDGLFAALMIEIEGDERIRAAWLWGSFMRGEQDALSDLDIWLAVPDEHVDQMAASVAAMCNTAGTVAFAAQNKHNAPKHGGYLGALIVGTRGLHHLDIYWQAMSVVEYPATKMFVDRRSESPSTFRGAVQKSCHATDQEHVSPTPLPSEGEVGGLANRKMEAKPRTERSFLKPLEDPDPSVNKIAFVWLMLSVAAKHLARDPSSDMSLVSYPRNSFEEVAAETGRTDLIATTHWTASDDPADKVQMLRQIAVNTALLEEALRETGLPLSTLANPCLMCYFDMVGSLGDNEGV